MSGYEVTNMSDEMSRRSYWLGEAYFWLFMALASWAALSGAPWRVAFAVGGALTLGNIIARWGEWRDMARYSDYVMIFLNWAAVYAWQTTVIFVVFAVARYLRRFVPEPILFRTLESWTYVIAALVVLAVAFGIVRILDDRAAARQKSEAEEAAYQAARKAPMDLPRDDGDVMIREAPNGARQRMSVASLTFETLYVGYHFYHQLSTPARGLTGFANLEKADSSPARIAKAEARLGLSFSDDVCRCYLTQNGGRLGAVLFNSKDGWEEAIDHILPLESLKVLATEIDAEPTSDYPNPTQTLIIAQDDYEMLLVDLITGKVTLEISPDYAVVTPLSEDRPAASWPDFAAFVGSLHRVPLVVTAR